MSRMHMKAAADGCSYSCSSLVVSKWMHAAIPAESPPVASCRYPKTAGPKYPAMLPNVFQSARPPACAGRDKLPKQDAVSGAVALHAESATQSVRNDSVPLTAPLPLRAGESIKAMPPIAKGTAVWSRRSLYLHTQEQCCHPMLWHSPQCTLRSIGCAASISNPFTQIDQGLPDKRIAHYSV
jgi:hypothetical protein